MATTRTISLASVIALLLFSLGAQRFETPRPDATNNIHPLADTRTVKITDGGFAPGRITVARGATVTWVNTTNRDDSISGANQAFRSGVIKRGESFSQKFTSPGTYRYSSDFFPRRRGIVIVQ